MPEPDFPGCAIPFTRQRSPLRARIGRGGARRIESFPGIARLAPGKAQLYLMDDFLGPEQCDTLIGLIDGGSAPSPIFDADKHPGHRTSYTCHLGRSNPTVLQTDLAICGLLGLEHENGESLQGQSYLAGQEFKRHADFFYIDQPYWDEVKVNGGQRTWTAMIYLDEPEAGGATCFPHLELEISPKRGRLLAWNNMAEDGSPNSWTIHEGQPVGRGVKHIVTKWFREKAWL